jgi:hypothetical protein
MIMISPSLILGLLATYGVAQFGSASFDDRVAAQRLVEALGDSAKPALNSSLCSALKSKNAEIVRRCETALSKLNDFGLTCMPRIEFFPISPQNKEEFQLWKFPLRIGEDYAWADARERKPRPSGDWIKRRATYHFANEVLLQAKWSRKEIRKLLLDMQGKEIAWELAFSTLAIGK